MQESSGLGMMMEKWIWWQQVEWGVMEVRVFEQGMRGSVIGRDSLEARGCLQAGMG